MNKELTEVNEIYLQIDGRYFDMPEDKLDEQLKDRNMRAEYSRIYNSGLDKFLNIATNLTSAEVIEGFEQGCKLLQRNLSGYMSNHFDKAYVSIMTKSIKNEDVHVSYIFLQTLADQLGKEIGPIVMEALDSKSALIRETALSVAEQINLLKVAPKIKTLINDVSPEVAFLARKIIESWEN